MILNMIDLFKKDVILIYRNDEDKRFHLCESQSMIAHVDHMFSSQMMFDQFSQLKEDVLSGKVVVDILETGITDKFIRQTKLLKYRNDLLDKGYVEYSTTRFINAKVKMRIVNYRKKYMVTVYISIGTKKRQVLGAFDNISQAKEFMDTHYPDGNIVSDKIVFADNELTQKFNDSFTIS
jgi:hypothetical protein